MTRIQTPFFVALLLVALPAAAPASPSDDAFNAVIYGINESAGKIADAQAKRAKTKAADAKAPSCTPDQIDDAFAALPRCEAMIQKVFGADVRDFRSVLKKGFTRDGFSLVLLTTTDAYFYHEDCDICAAVERCSLKDGSLANFKTAHSVTCSDFGPLLKKKVAYSACPLRP